MKLMIQSWNDGAQEYNAEVEETALRSYTIDHQFNRPAKAVITLADPTGALMRKYDSDINALFYGLGKITLEDPTGTDIFYGRITKVQGSFQEKKLYLTCEDWLSQLDEEHITYDMREDLDGSGLRQSALSAVPDYDIYPAYTDGTPDQWLFDNDMAWAIDQWNDKKLMFTAGTAGTVTSSVGPYTAVGTTPDVGFGAQNQALLWNDDILGIAFTENVAVFNNYTVDLKFRTFGTADADNLYVASSIKSARLTLVCDFASAAAINTVQIWDYAAGPAAYVNISEIKPQGARQRITIDVPTDYLVDGSFIGTTGIGNFRFNITGVVATTVFNIFYAWLTVEFEAVGTPQLFTISDTVRGMDDGDGVYNTLKVTGDTVGVAGLNLWQDAPYCIMREIYKHIASDETPGGLVTDAGGDLSGTGPDPVVALTCAAGVEHTSGYSSRQYKETTRLKILQDLATQDKAVFWITLGGTTVTYKQTFGADTMQLTDGKIDDWQSIFDYKQLFNEYHVYGVRIGDGEVYQTVQNAVCVALYSATRSKVLRNAGLVSDAHASAVGTALVARDKDLLQMVGCTIAGNTATNAHATTIKLGEVVEITSSYLWDTAAKDYVVTRFAYDSSQHKTYLTLHPKSSIGYQEIDALYSKGQKMEEDTAKLKTEAYVADPVTHDVS
ncbi:MAG: hypothetical protein ACXABY_19885 [Candidatus Thorarchaeota archaeon]|jgi:hypothetical protein